jgi:HlyD family secretion protein/epimerase transport system membrane fusion protein
MKHAALSVSHQPVDADTSIDRLALLDLQRSLRRPAAISWIIIGGFLGAFGIWSATAPLSSAAVAQGTVSPEGARKTIQHLEGGIIRQIAVRDGDTVKAGDLLMVLDDTQAKATFGSLLGQWQRLVAMKMRIEALQSKSETLDFTARFPNRATDPDFDEFLNNETRIFETRRRTLVQQGQIYDQQIEQSREEIKGYNSQIESTEAQLGFFEEELVDAQYLTNQGLQRKPRFLELKRNRANLIGNRGQLVQSIAKANQKISEIALTQIDLENKFFNDQNDQITKTNSDLAQAEERLNAARDVLSRVEIRAPITGKVVNLRFRTTTGVVKPGEPILDIVPTEEDLVIDARVLPNDINTIKTGQTVQVHLTPYHTRYSNLLHGTLRDIGADTLTDEKTGAKYYKCSIVVDHDALSQIGETIQLAAGMPAEVFIKTGEHTFLAYMLEPFTRSLRRSFRDK